MLQTGKKELPAGSMQLLRQTLLETVLYLFLTVLVKLLCCSCNVESIFVYVR